jgi:hypothetical protein
MVTLTQIPPAADVLLTWECDVGHHFVATPGEQRNRPTGERRRSVWCPECAELAINRPMLDPAKPRTVPPPRKPRGYCAKGHPLTSSNCRICRHAAAAADRVAVGDAFVSPWAPKPASAVEGDLRQRIEARFDVDLAFNAVKVARPFFTHLEVWPDLVLDPLRVAVELDTVGRHGLEHVGRRESIDKRKDRLLRAVGWEVIRIRLGKLQPLGPFDVCGSGVTEKLLDRVDDRLADIRGPLFVAAYRR